jgi:hypothetical protein
MFLDPSSSVKNKNESYNIVLHSFNGEEATELTVQAGDVVDVLETSINGWVKCRVIAGGKEGFVPEDFIKEKVLLQNDHFPNHPRIMPRK